MVNPYRFYTYAYLREDKTPYYIGKGKNNRAYVKHQKGIHLPKDKSRIIFLKQNLTEEEAFKHEKYMIAVFGRKDLGTGILHNKSDGGEGISNPSFETRRKMSEAKKGKSHSEKSKRKMSEGRKGENNHQYGKSHSEKSKRKMSEANKGENNPHYGKKWWNDGNGNVIRSIKCPGEGWVLGRNKISEETREKIRIASIGINIGKKWWNDGNGNNKFLVECPGEGWVPGMMKKRRRIS